MKVGTAESFTSGAIARKFTSIPGSSAFFEGSVVAYSAEVKQNLLAVPAELIEKHGIFSREVAESMAIGGAQTLGVDICLSSTGIAGPTGGTIENPVGTVCLAIAKCDSVRSWKMRFEGSREEVVEKSVDFLFSRLADVLDETEKSRFFALLNF